MSIRCSTFIATSLDGFISRKDGSIDWLNEINHTVPSGEDCGYAAFMSTVDGLVMGRNTFEQVLYFREWPYSSKPIVVISHFMKTLPDHAPTTVSLSDEEPNTLINRLEREGLKHLYIDGGLTIQSFLMAGLIDEITITTMPILLGSGKPLFSTLPKDLHLQLLSSKAFEFGLVQNKYQIKKQSPSVVKPC